MGRGGHVCQDNKGLSTFAEEFKVLQTGFVIGREDNLLCKRWEKNPSYPKEYMPKVDRMACEEDSDC